MFLSQRQPKNLLRLLSSSSISRNPSLPKGFFKRNDKRCEICRLYLIESSEFELANRKIWKIKTNITCRSRNIIYYLKCKFCMYETYIGKTVGDHIHVIKTRMSNHITESRSGVSTCKFPILVFNCIKRNNRQLEEPFFLYIRHALLKSNSCLESLETFHKRGYDTLNNPSRNIIHETILAEI